MRDLETISIALTAAETGHLVLSTLHTIGAAKTIDRVIDVFPPHQQQQIRFQLSTVLQGVISQQLIPRKDGQGRAAAVEVMVVTSAIRNLIREGKTYQITNVIQTGARLGMKTMDQALAELYNRDIITKEDALLYAIDADNIRSLLNR
jgi:twitching motility protein PilT